jgi:antitoxin component of RelBE/YafQ-DinJ toxin-antitoxin module
MAQTQLATRIDTRVKRAVEKVCEARGLKMNRFIEEALLDKLEEMEDIEDLKKIRCEPSRSLEDLLKDLKLDGKL